MHRVLFGGDHFARPRHGPASLGLTAPSARKRTHAISEKPVATIAESWRRVGVSAELGRVGVLKALVTSPLPTKHVDCANTPHHGAVGLKRVLQSALASTQSTTSASYHASRPSAPPSKRTGESKTAPAAVQKSPSPVNRGGGLTGTRRSGVLGVLTNYCQAIASPSSTSKSTAASSTSSRAASASTHMSGGQL